LASYLSILTIHAVDDRLSVISFSPRLFERGSVFLCIGQGADVSEARDGTGIDAYRLLSDRELEQTMRGVIPLAGIELDQLI
jgi:hypothetical protein